MPATPALTTVLVRDVVKDHQGLPAVGVKVTASVPFRRQVYIDTDVRDLIPQAVYAITDENGYWSMRLVPQDLCDPSGWCYHFDHFYEHWDALISSGGPPGGWQASDPTIQCVDTSGGEGAGGGLSTNCKVAVEAGDSCGFLEDKIVAGPGITVTKTGTLPNEQLEIGAADVDVAAGTLNVVIDGSGAVIAPGIVADYQLDFAGSILKATLLGDQVGSLVVDVWKAPYASFPPTVLNTITGAAPPTIAAGIKSQDAVLTGWTTAFVAGDILRFNVESAASITRATLALTIQRSF